MTSSAATERRLETLLKQLNGCACSCNKQHNKQGTAPLVRVCTSAATATTHQPFPKYDPKEAQKYINDYPSIDPDLALRCYTSRLIGSRSDLVLHGGGNTSVKLTVQNCVGESIQVLGVKGSGYNLDSIVPKGFPLVDLNHLNKLLNLPALSDVQMVNELRTHLQDNESPNPSVETLLHALLPAKFVDHSHADAIVALADLGDQSETILREAFAGSGIELGIVPYAKPGIDLSLVCTRMYRANPNIDAIILLQHGLVTWGNTAKESYEMHIKCVEIALQFIHSKVQQRTGPLLIPNATAMAGAATNNQRRLVLVLIRGVLSNLEQQHNQQHNTSHKNHRWIVKHRPNQLVLDFCNSKQLATWSQIGTITPDHVIRTKGLPCVLDVDLFGSVHNDTAAVRQKIKASIQHYVAQYHQYFQRNNDRVGGKMIELDPFPRIFLVPGLGLLTAGRSTKECNISADIYVQTVPVILNCYTLIDRYVPVPEER